MPDRPLNPVEIPLPVIGSGDFLQLRDYEPGQAPPGAAQLAILESTGISAGDYLNSPDDCGGFAGFGCGMGCSGSCGNDKSASGEVGFGAGEVRQTTMKVAVTDPRIMSRNGQVIRIALPGNGSMADAERILPLLKSLGDMFGRRPEVRQAAISIIGRTGDNDVPTQIARIFAWVKQNMIYARDPAGTEFTQSPLYLLDQLKAGQPVYGDCDDHVVLLNALLTSLGIATKYIGVKVKTPDRYDHIIAAAWDGRRWVDLDPTIKTREQPRYLNKIVA